MDEWKQDRETCERATPGPWGVYRITYEHQPGHLVIGSPDPRDLKHDVYPTAHDAACIAAARTRWPAALDRIAALEAERDAAYARGFADAKARAVEAVENCDGDEESQLTWTLAVDAIRAIEPDTGGTVMLPGEGK